MIKNQSNLKKTDIGSATQALEALGDSFSSYPPSVVILDQRRSLKTQKKENMDQKLKVGFIGLGLMGSPMAKNVHRAGFPLTVYNRRPQKTIEFKKMGIPVSSSPKELALTSDVVITMVTGPKDVEEVLLGKNGVIHGARKDLIVIDMSTIGPQAAKEVAKNLAKHGLGFLDAPVTGSTPRAISGELTIFIGGKKKVFEKVKPVLSSMGTTLQYLGPVGSGQAVKLVNNHLVGTTLVALAESLLLADAQGISRQKISQVLSETPVFSHFMRLKLPLLLKHQFPTLFSLSNMSKDLTLALKEAQRAKKNLQFLKLVEKLYREGLKMKLNNEDNSAILKVLERKN